MPDWLTIKEAANYLKCSEATIYRRIKTGELPTYKTGKLTRIKREDLDDLLKGK